VFEEQLGETGGTIAQFGLSLIVVVALIFLVAWVVKRFGGSRFGGHHGDEAELQVVSTLAIDPKRKLVLVRHGKLEHLLLIGGGSDAVIERSMIGGIPLAARMQASKAQEKQEEESYSRPADRFRTSNRFSSALLRSKAAEETSERPPSLSRSSETPQSDNTQKAATAATAGAAAATAAVAAASTRPATPAPPTSSSAKATEPRPPVTETAKARPAEPTPSAQDDERAAIDRSLDEALSASLLDDMPPPAAPGVEPAKPDPLAPKTAVKDSAPPAETAPVAPSTPMDDLSLERELEAALELDAFERTPSAAGSDHAPIDLPPLDDLPDLPDLSTLTGNGDEAPAEPKAAEAKAGELASKEPESVDKPDPLKLSSVREAAPATSPTTTDEPASADQDAKADDQPADVSPQGPDIPVALSGRDDPPIPVAIPSRGPAANATTLAKADDEKTTAAPETSGDDAVDISSMLQPSGGGKADGEPKGGKSDDLDDEMRRLLGEIAGDPEQK
jgi:flagellar protein FliO/FliZ